MLTRLEALFLDEGPAALRWLAAAMALAGLAGVLVLAGPGGARLAPSLVGVGILMWLPAMVCLALAWAVSARHVATVPLAFVLAALALWSLRGMPMALNGISGPLVLAWLPWILGALELAAAAVFLAVVLRLMRAGSFRRRG